MATGSEEITRPAMPEDLFILDPANQPFLIGTWSLWYVGKICLNIFLLVAIPSFLVVYMNNNPLNYPTVNTVVIGLIIFAPTVILIYVGIRKYLAWVKLKQMKRDGQILIGKIAGIKTQIRYASKGQEIRKSKVRYEFKNPIGKELAAYTEYRPRMSSPNGKSVAILYVSDDNFMAL